jgi:hypothetical protein
MKNKEKLERALSKVISKNYKLELGEDTFLSGLFDGSDKVYGFINYNGNIIVKTRGGKIKVSELENGDIRYIFNQSLIYNKIVGNEYSMYKLDENELSNLKCELGF